MSNTDSQSSFNTAVLTRRVLFFVLLISLTLTQLLVLFRGLDTAKGMDQAQLAREMARGNGYTTKVVRPVAVGQSQLATEGEGTLVEATRDTYHSPLHPMLNAGVLKLVDGGNADKWRMAEGDTVYKLDRVIAAVSVLCFLTAIGINYLLICRIFDGKIAGVTAIIMLLCDLNWKFTSTGLPQMFMLLLFSCACFFAYRAVENTEEDGIALIPALIAGFFFALLCLTHWIAVWILIGWVVYAAFFIRPRGIAALGAIVIFIAFASYFIVKNNEYSGSPGGTALLALYSGLGGSEDYVMRIYDLGDANLPYKNLPIKVLKASVAQGNTLFASLGSIVVAPLFFLALFHPFKRRSIASFRWGILSMWGFGALGMALFGAAVGTESNQLHILFAPLTSAYGLAFLAIIWSKLTLPTTVPMLKNAHFVVAVLLSAAPLLLPLPRDAVRRLVAGDKPVPHWPPYYPSTLNNRLANYVDEDEIVISDQPWAVAWYADRTSIWLPTDLESFEVLEGMAEDHDTPVAGILLSPYSHGVRPLFESYTEYSHFAPLVLDGWATAALRARRAGVLAMQDEKMKGVLSRYSNPAYLNGSLLMYWSAEPVWDTDR
jgi:hypothetical protein